MRQQEHTKAPALHATSSRKMTSHTKDSSIHSLDRSGRYETSPANQVRESASRDNVSQRPSGISGGPTRHRTGCRTARSVGSAVPLSFLGKGGSAQGHGSPRTVWKLWPLAQSHATREPHVGGAQGPFGVGICQHRVSKKVSERLSRVRDVTMRRRF